MYKVLIQSDDSGRITAVNSDAFILSVENWTQIDEGDGDRYHHAQGNYFPMPLMTDEGVYRYKLDKGKVKERSPEDIQSDIDALPEPKPAVEQIIFRTLTKSGVISEDVASDYLEMFPTTDDVKELEPMSYYRHNNGLYRAIPHLEIGKEKSETISLVKCEKSVGDSKIIGK